MENTIRVLIADEDKEFCAMLRETFCIDERMEIIGTYGDGNGLAQRILQDAPDVVLMDIRMPVMDGLEATRRIRSVSADVPIIAMSAYSSGSEIESARNAGCNEFLVKPLSQYSLHRALNAALVEFKGKGKS